MSFNRLGTVILKTDLKNIVLQPLYIVWNFALAQQGKNKPVSTGLVLYIAMLSYNAEKKK